MKQPETLKEIQKAFRDLNEKTQADYLRLAEHFYKRVDDSPTPKRLRNALRFAAAEYRPAYWRRLRNAIMYDQAKKGWSESALAVAKVNNPITNPITEVEVRFSETYKKKPKAARAKGVSEADLKVLKQALASKKDLVLSSAVAISSILGCRPAEIMGIELKPGNQVFIPGAKHSGKLNRGLDRLLEVNERSYSTLKVSLAILKKAEPGRKGVIHQVQCRLDRLVRELWPRRKARPSLYSFRHQLGSDLKSSGKERTEIAYIMGHASTESVEVYGDRRRASRARAIKPAPGIDPAKYVRICHEEPGPKSRQSSVRLGM